MCVCMFECGGVQRFLWVGRQQPSLSHRHLWSLGTPPHSRRIEDSKPPLGCSSSRTAACRRGWIYFLFCKIWSLFLHFHHPAVPRIRTASGKANTWVNIQHQLFRGVLAPNINTLIPNRALSWTYTISSYWYKQEKVLVFSLADINMRPTSEDCPAGSLSLLLQALFSLQSRY